MSYTLCHPYSSLYLGNKNSIFESFKLSFLKRLAESKGRISFVHWNSVILKSWLELLVVGLLRVEIELGSMWLRNGATVQCAF